uniref:Acrosin n=1 Tax=Callorhinchus milii TaxID=7868 RepID=A0A4W3JHJ1_CALMI
RALWWFGPVSLQLGRSHQHVCGASIISDWWLISAAHCFGRRKTAWRASLGLRDQWKPDSWTVVRDIDALIIHENYSNINNDVALLRVDKAIEFGENIRPVCLPSQGEAVENTWKGCHVTGWGRMEKGGRTSAHILQEAAVNIIPTATCQQPDWYGRLVNENMVCAGFAGGGIDACQGDSGGPLSCRHKHTERFYLVGLVSWGQGCAERFRPGVYTRTSNYINWINKKTSRFSASDPEQEPERESEREPEHPHVMHQDTSGGTWANAHQTNKASATVYPQGTPTATQPSSTRTAQPPTLLTATIFASLLLCHL